MMNEKPEKRPSGAKAHVHFAVFFGTTEVVPYYKTGVFPQPVQAHTEHRHDRRAYYLSASELPADGV
jgi:hypothetical protein